MRKQSLKNIVTPALMQGAILNEEYTGFKEDYSVLHCLLKKYKPKRFLEIGTNMGTGTMIIKNALGEGSEVFSLDLPTHLAHASLQHPIMEGKGDNVGIKCTLPFTQLRGSSLEYDYKPLYPLHGWFIDGEHIYQNVFAETGFAIKSKAKIIIYHDTDIADVFNAIVDSFDKHNGNKHYTLYRVFDTRISYALRNK